MTKDWVGIAEARRKTLHVKNAEIGRLRAELYDTTRELRQCREALAAAKETLSEGYGTSCQECWQDVLERPGGIRFATAFLCNEHYNAALEQERDEGYQRGVEEGVEDALGVRAAKHYQEALKAQGAAKERERIAQEVLEIEEEEFFSQWSDNMKFVAGKIREANDD